MARRRQKPQSLIEMVLHPWSNLKRMQGLDRLPDRRVSRRTVRPEDSDPIRQGGRAAAIYKALGLYASEESRVELYENYREMDYDALISAVIDAFGEDAAQIDPEHGRAVWCEAKNSDIQEIVIKCMDRLKIEQNAFSIMRTLARDGDTFEHVAAARGKGIIALKPYDAWQVARIEDDIGRLVGFAPADERGIATKADTHSLPYYKVLHFRLPPRDRTNIYGAESSFLWGSRVQWRQLQLMLDQVVIQRLLRRPDRLALLVDTAGMSHDDSHFFIEDMKRSMYREWHLNPNGAGGQGGGFLTSIGMPVDDAQDVVISRGPNNSTEITNFPATNQNDLLRDLDMMYSNLANGIGFPHGYLRGEGKYNPEQSLSRQHQPFAKRASRLQRSFLTELVRMCMVDLAFKGLDPTLPANKFSLHMAPVAPILELERHEVIQMKMDRLERALRLGVDNQFNPDVWVPLSLRIYGGFPDDVINQVYVKGGGDQQQQGGNPFESLKVDRETLTELTKSVAKHFAPGVSKMNPLSESTEDVMDLYGADSRLKPKGGKGKLDESWKKASASDRSLLVNPALQEDKFKEMESGATIIETKIEPINDSSVMELRMKKRQTRQQVIKSLLASGRL